METWLLASEFSNLGNQRRGGANTVRVGFFPCYCASTCRGIESGTYCFYGFKVLEGRTNVVNRHSYSLATSNGRRLTTALGEDLVPTYPRLQKCARSAGSRE